MSGGVKFNATCKITGMGDDPQDATARILASYRIHNAEVLIREDCTLDDLIDVIEGNRRYLKCLYVYNKVDLLSIQELDELARKENSLVVSVHNELNLDYMLQRMWHCMGLVRIYTKRRGQAPDLNEPVVITDKRHGTTVESACKAISSDLLEKFNFAYVWGTSTKFSPQRVGLTHTLHDEDVMQIVSPTLLIASIASIHCCFYNLYIPDYLTSLPPFPIPHSGINLTPISLP